MGEFGDATFGSRRFIRWTLTPFVLALAILALYPGVEWPIERVAVTVGIELLCIGLLVGYWLPARIGRWGFRVVAGTVFVLYSVYLVDQLLFTDAPLRVIESGSESSPRNAILGYVLIGVPSLWVALLGRFTLRARQPDFELDEADDVDPA